MTQVYLYATSHNVIPRDLPFNLPSEAEASPRKLIEADWPVVLLADSFSQLILLKQKPCQQYHQN